MLLFESNKQIDFNTTYNIINKIKVNVGSIKLDDIFKDDIKQYIDKVLVKRSNNVNITDETKKEFYKCLFDNDSGTFSINIFIQKYIKMLH